MSRLGASERAPLQQTRGVRGWQRPSLRVQGQAQEHAWGLQAEPPKGHEGPPGQPHQQETPSPLRVVGGAEKIPRWEFAGSLAPPPTPRLAQGRDQAGEEGCFHLNETWKPSHYSGRGSFYTEKM